jgi:cell division septal protein FtsQ
MGLAKRAIAFTASFLLVLVLGGGLALSLRAGLFDVRAIPIDFALVAVPGGEALEAAGDASAGPPGAGSAAARPGLDARAAQRLRERVAERIKPFLGRKVWEIDLEAVRAAIVADEWVRSARVSRSFPAEVRAAISAKRPELLFIGSDGRLRPIADDGSLLNAIAPTILPDVPIARGAALAASSELRKKTVEFARGLPDRGPLSRHNIAEIVYTPDEGYTLALSSAKAEVRLGDERLPLKAARAAQVLEYLAANKLKGRVIDASFSKKVLVRLRKGP